MDFCRHFIILGLTFSVLYGCAGVGQKDASFKPMLRQSGKDVMWLPTSQHMVNKMLTAAQVTAKDIVYDLGSGDGVIPITVAQQFKARAVGVEYDAKLAEFARKNAQQAGVADKIGRAHV